MNFTNKHPIKTYIFFQSQHTYKLTQIHTCIPTILRCLHKYVHTYLHTIFITFILNYQETHTYTHTQRYKSVHTQITTHNIQKATHQRTHTHTNTRTKGSRLEIRLTDTFRVRNFVILESASSEVILLSVKMSSWLEIHDTGGFLVFFQGQQDSREQGENEGANTTSFQPAS